MTILKDLIETSGLYNMTMGHLLMIIIAVFFLYLGIFKKYEPYLLIPIAFGMLLSNLPLSGMMDPATASENGGLLYYLYQGTELGIYPPLIFISLGASIDFGPLLANPKTMLIGAAAQVGLFATFFFATLIGMTPQEAAATAIIGSADGPTTIFTATKLAPHILPTIALAAYSYMALVPFIQPPIIRLLTTEEERKIEMPDARQVSKKEKIIFPIAVTIIVSLLVPSATTLIGLLMLGNLIKESEVVPLLTNTMRDSFMYILTILLGISVGAKAEAELFLSVQTLQIILLGLIAFAISTASGVLFAKLMNKMLPSQTNPIIGAAGVSAIPMAARVVQQEGQKANPENYLLMHAMGPNVAAVISSAVVAGVFISFFG